MAPGPPHLHLAQQPRLIDFSETEKLYLKIPAMGLY